MGDRTNFVITTKSTANAATLEQALEGAIVLYSHDGGYNAGPDLARALKAASDRWRDLDYGPRIIVSQIIGKDWSEKTGFGLLSGDIGDNENAVFVVDFERKIVSLYGQAGKHYSPESALEASVTASWTFADFAALSEDDARAAHQGPESDD